MTEPEQPIDPNDQIRRRVEAMTPDQLNQMLAGIAAAAPIAVEPPAANQPIELPAPPDTPAALTVRLDLDGAKPPIWRRLVLAGDLRLSDVHDLIQAAMGWDDCHLHRFWPGPEKNIWRGPHFITEADLDEGETGTLENDVRLDQVIRTPGDRLFYVYDFGDGWEHTILLEKVGPREPDDPRARCTAARRAGPLEDVGGVHTYNELTEAYRKDPSRGLIDEQYREWLPSTWDPENEDPEQVNERLALAGATPRQLAEALAAEGQGWGIPQVLEPIMAIAPMNAAFTIGGWCHEAALTPPAPDPDVVTEFVRPYRLMLDLAADGGIPLTQAGWMKPAVVQHIYDELGMERHWIGKGNREDQTYPVAQLRQFCLDASLLRKYRGRLLPTRLGNSLTTDERLLSEVCARLIPAGAEYQRATVALVWLAAAATGELRPENVERVAHLLGECGLSAGGAQITGWDVRGIYSPLDEIIERCTRVDGGSDPAATGGRITSTVACWALWPQLRP